MPTFKEEHIVNPSIEIQLNIEELERKIAPGGGETVLPLGVCPIALERPVIDTPIHISWPFHG